MPHESLAPEVAVAARAFWGDALDLDRIRCVDSAVARTTGRAFVTWNTIHWPGPPPTRATDPAMHVMIHELAHCWQHQTGRLQLLRGILEQTLYTLFGWWMMRIGLRPLYDPYDYGGPEGIVAASGLEEFSLEAQATIVEHHWTTRNETSPYARNLARLCRQAGVQGLDRHLEED
jgi:hypothetical protein